MDTLALFLPFLKCVYCNNPLSTFTKHIIMLQYFYQASQNRNNLYLQQLNIVLISFDYLNQYDSYIKYILILIGITPGLFNFETLSKPNKLGGFTKGVKPT